MTEVLSRCLVADSSPRPPVGGQLSHTPVAPLEPPSAELVLWCAGVMICVRAGPGDPWFRDGMGTLPSSQSILFLLLSLQVFISGLVTFPKKESSGLRGI